MPSTPRPSTGVALLLGALLLALGAEAARAQTGVGVGFRVAEPRGSYADVVAERGYGAVGMSVVTGQSVWLSMTTGWTRFRAPDPVEGEEGGEGEAAAADQTIYEAMLGWGLRIGPLRGGIRVGRFFGDDRSWAYMPVAGIGVGPLLVMAEWDPRGPAEWAAVTATWIW